MQPFAHSISQNRRGFSDAQGNPWFWLGDTAWELFHRLTLQEASDYLQNRRKLGFNIIQAVAVPELAGLSQPNRSGDLPFIDLDPARPSEHVSTDPEGRRARVNRLGRS